MVIAQLTTDNREAFQEYHKVKPWFGPAPEALLQGFAKLPAQEIHVIACTQQIISSPEKLADNIWFHSIHVPKLGWLRTGYQGCIRAARRVLREIGPDIVHGQGTERDCAVSAIFSGRPNVVTIHGNMVELARMFRARPFSFDWLAARLEEFTLPRTRGVFCNSAYTESLVAPRAPQTWRVPNAIRDAFFDLAPSAARTGCPIVINIGVVSPRKRQLEVLDLAAALRREGAEIEFEFIGPCTGATEYQRVFLSRIADAERAGVARWIGTMNVDDLIARLDTASAVLHFPNEEAFGLVVAEALARNLKFFGSRLGGIMEIAAGAPLAELFEADDWTGLATGIRRWLAAGAPRPSDAAEKARAAYAPMVIATRHVEIYRELLNSC